MTRARSEFIQTFNEPSPMLHDGPMESQIELSASRRTVPASRPRNCSSLENQRLTIPRHSLANF